MKSEDMIGRTPFDLMPPEARDLALTEFGKVVVSPNKIRGMEVKANDANGAVILLELTGVPFFDDAGKLLGYQGVARAIADGAMKNSGLITRTE
jgi:PAS domain S-box-containing protein